MIILLLTLLELTQTNTHDVGGHDEPGPSLLEEVTDDTIGDVLKHNKHVLIDFYVARKDMAIPNDPTTSLSSYIVAKRMAEDEATSNIKFVKMEVKLNPVTSEKYGIKQYSYPSKVLLSEGSEPQVISPMQRELYYPTTLYNWLYKRTVGAMYNVTVKRDWAKVVADNQAVVLVIGEQSLTALTAASLDLPEVSFYHCSQTQTYADSEYNSELLEGAVYVVKKFVGEPPLQYVTLDEDLLISLQLFTSPLVMPMSQQLMGKVQLDSLWMLGLALAPSKPSHSALTEVFVEALGELRDMEHPVQGTILNIEDTEDEMTERRMDYFKIGASDAPCLFLMKRSREDDHKEVDKESITLKSVMDFFFQAVLNLDKKKRAELEKEKERKKRKRTEAPAKGWADKRVAALVGSVFEEWLETAPRKAVLLAYPELGVKVTKALLALGKVEAKLRGRARFGKVNYVANELSLIPSPSFAVYTLYRNHKEWQVLKMDGTLDVTSIEDFVRGTLDLAVRDEL